MNEQLGESLSALMDGEADDKALDQVLDNVHDEALRDTWRRFHTASHGLQSGLVVTGTDLSGSIMAAIAQEPTFGTQPSEESENHPLGEALSALMDGEASNEDVELVLDTLQDPVLRNSWRRFHTASQALQPGQVIAGADLSGRIMAAVEQEPTYSDQPDSQPATAEIPDNIESVAGWQRLLRPLASFAVAASVFAVVLVGSQFYGLQEPQTGEAAIPVAATGVERVSPTGVAPTGVAPTGVVPALGGRANLAGYATPSGPVINRPVQPRAEAPHTADYNTIARQRLERYMLEHAEEASLNAPQGMMPYARVATFSAED